MFWGYIKRTQWTVIEADRSDLLVLWVWMLLSKSMVFQVGAILERVRATWGADFLQQANRDCKNKININ